MAPVGYALCWSEKHEGEESGIIHYESHYVAVYTSATAAEDALTKIGDACHAYNTAIEEMGLEGELLKAPDMWGYKSLPIFNGSQEPQE